MGVFCISLSADIYFTIILYFCLLGTSGGCEYTLNIIIIKCRRRISCFWLQRPLNGAMVFGVWVSVTSYSLALWKERWLPVTDEFFKSVYLITHLGLNKNGLFCFQMTFSIAFSWKKIDIFWYYTLLKLILWVPADIKLPLIWVMTWPQTGYKPLVKPLMIEISATHRNH